ncbi:hypothetical protein [Oceanobacillus sp. FSL W7-1281]
MKSLLKVKNVEKVFGKGVNTFKALDDNSFKVERSYHCRSFGYTLASF